jgi:Beta/Gamma crystallin
MIRTALALVLMTAATAASAQLTLYEHDNFGGRQYDVRGAVEDLGNTGFNDTASSARVRRGTWQVCDDAYFRGRCVTLQPGEYPSLGSFGLNDKISSARELGGYGAPPSQGGNWGGGARAVLYENPGFGGRSLVIDNNVVRDLANTGFNDRASSLRIEQGYWMFCSDANFEGQCQTFGPGEYPELPRSLTNRISSGRRISSQYPYHQNPNWGR